MNLNFRLCRIAIGLAMAGATLAFQGCIAVNLLGSSSNRGKVSLEIIEPANHWYTVSEIMMIPISGAVTMGSEGALLGGSGMLVAVEDQLRAAEANPFLKAVILRIDSPGGGVTASDLIYREIVRFKQKKHVPVIAIMTDMAASGGLYIAMAADEIYALPTTVTGSIGVIIMLPGLKGLSDKIGFSMNIIKSGEHKDLGSPWKDMPASERKIFQDLIDTMYARFLQVVLTSRESHGLTSDALRAIADGRVLDSASAVKAHLIDGIKYMDEVVILAKQKAGIDDANVISYEYPSHYRGHYYASTNAEAPAGAAAQPGSGDMNLLKVDLGDLIEPKTGARFYYLWMPGL